MINKLKNLVRLFYDYDFRFRYFQAKGVYDRMPDEKYLEKAFEVNLHKKLNLSNPKTFNEKLQWLKLYNRKEEYLSMVDKVKSKKYVADKIGEEYIIPTIGVWDKFEEIDFSALPDKFVMKCTHDSGNPIICRDKDKLDINKSKKYISHCLKRNFFFHSREWPYKNLKPRIIVEQYMYDDESDTENLTDYKFFCFGGEPKYVYTVRDREKGHDYALHRFYDIEWNLQKMDLDHRGELNVPEEKPSQLEKMIEIAMVLSHGIPFVRVDLYQSKEQVYFGEMTFFPRSGWEAFDPEEWDIKLGDLIDLNTL